jgi:hypothetical protein
MTIDDFVGTWTCDHLQIGSVKQSTWYPTTGPGGFTLEKVDEHTLRIAALNQFGDVHDYMHARLASPGYHLHFTPAAGSAISPIFPIEDGDDAERLQIIVSRLADGVIRVVQVWTFEATAHGVTSDSGIWHDRRT